MNLKKYLLSISGLLAVCCLLILNISAQNQTNSPVKKGKLSDIKNKQSVFVNVADKTTKEKIESLFRNEGQFTIAKNLTDAEIVFTAYQKAEIKPAFGTVERQIQLPALSNNERAFSAQKLSNNKYEYRRKTLASVYYDRPDGKRIIVWQNAVLKINDSQQPGSGLLYLYAPGEEIYLAGEFLKAMKK